MKLIRILECNTKKLEIIYMLDVSESEWMFRGMPQNDIYNSQKAIYA